MRIEYFVSRTGYADFPKCNLCLFIHGMLRRHLFDILSIEVFQLWILQSLIQSVRSFGVLCSFPSLPELGSLLQRGDILPQYSECKQRHDDREDLGNVQVMCERQAANDDADNWTKHQPEGLLHVSICFALLIIGETHHWQNQLPRLVRAGTKVCNKPEHDDATS